MWRLCPLLLRRGCRLDERGAPSRGRIRAEGARAPQRPGLRLGVVGTRTGPTPALLAAQSRANRGGGFVDSKGARMTTVSFPLPQRNPISRSDPRGRSPPWWALTTCASHSCTQTERKDTNGDTIRTEVQRSLRSREGHGGPAGHAGAGVDHPGGRRNSQLAPGQQEAKDSRVAWRERGLGRILGFLDRDDLLRALPWRGDRRDVGCDERRGHRRRLYQTGSREGNGGHLRPVRADQWGDGGRQGGRRTEGVRLRDHLDQPARGAGEATARGLRPRVVEVRSLWSGLPNGRSKAKKTTDLKR